MGTEKSSAPVKLNSNFILSGLMIDFKTIIDME